MLNGIDKLVKSFRK